MIRIIIILVLLSSCQKEIECPWGNCGEQPAKFKSFAIQERGGYDMNEYNLDLPYVLVNSYTVMIHPDYYSSLLGKDSITINLPDSAGEYAITEKFFYTGLNNRKVWAFQIGGGYGSGWGTERHFDTYFILDIDSVQYEQSQTFNFK